MPRRQDFRNVSNYRIAELSEWFQKPIRWSALRLGRGVAPAPPQEWRNGVILGPSHIGDVLYNTPSLPALHAGLPECQWTYLVSRQASEVLQGNPYLRIISIDDAEGSRSWSGKIREELKRNRFDVALTYSVGSAWRELVPAILSGIPNRVGYVHKGFSGLVTHPVSIHFPQSFPAYFRDLVSQVIDQPAEKIPSLRPLVYTRGEDDEAVDRLCTKAGLDWDRQPVLACSVTSRQPSGVWPIGNFLKSIQYVKKKMPCSIVYLGAKSGEGELHRLASQTGPDTFVFAGELKLPEVVSLLRRCQAALMSDSGPRHLANAANLPVVFVRNISFRAVEAGAYCETDHDMAPRELELISPSEQGAAWTQISPEKVGEQVVRLLAGSSIA